MPQEPFIMPDMPPTQSESGKVRHFPAAVQLSILGLILLTIFGGIVMPALLGTAPTNNTATLPTAPSSEDANALPVITSITAPRLTADSAYVYDVTTKRALYEKNPDEVVPLASITKLMTTLVASELMRGDTNVTVPPAAATQQSSSGLAPGERFTQATLRDYAMMASSNDAAYSLAAAAGSLLTETGDAHATFVEAMNITAEELELPTLRFYNATGLDRSTTEAGAYGSARDVTFLMEHILATAPELLEATTMTSDLVYNTAGSYHEAENTNPVINRIPNLIGSKTGYTNLAGGNLTIAFDAGYNRPIIITVLGSGYDERFADTMVLVAAVQDAFAAATAAQ